MHRSQSEKRAAMRLERIDEIFDFEKGTLQSTKCEPGEYDFITASREWKAHKDFSHNKEALVIAVAASGSLGRTHYVNGKFIASDLCFILTPKLEYSKVISLPFYQFIFNGLKSDLVKRCATGTAKQAINRTNFAAYRIPYFDALEQARMAERLKNTFAQQERLEAEIDHQQTLLAKLKQAILQEAIQGKLTADWRAANPETEPASELLKRIQAEKAKLIATKKLKKEKPLPPIKHEEIPFEIPEGWEWCRLGEICGFITKGTTPSPHELKSSGNIPFLKVYNIRDQKIDFAYQPQFVDRSIHEGILSRSVVYPQDILMNIVGPPLGKVAIVPNDYSEWNINQALAVFRPIKIEINQFLYLYLCEGAPIRNTLTKGVVGQDNISLTQCRELIFPLPPIVEQAAIVERVEALMKTCRDLETEIENSRTHASQLLQAILKEAFTPAS